MTIRWKKDCESSAAVLIESFKDFPDNASTRWYSHLLDVQIALSAFLNFDSVENKKKTLRMQIVEKAVTNAVRAGCHTTEDFLVLVNQSYTEIYSHKDSEFHIIASLNVRDSDELPFQSFMFKGARVEVIGRDLDSIYLQRNPKYSTYKEFSEPCFLKVVVYAKNPPDALRMGVNVLNYFRGLINLFNNNSRTILYNEPVQINKVQLGYLVSCHNPDGTLAGSESYVNASSKFALPVTISNPYVLKENFSKVHNGILTIVGHKDLSHVIILMAYALDEMSQESAFILAWSALEMLVATNEGNAADRVVERVSAIFKNNVQERAILQGLRMSRNELVHSVAGEIDYLNATYSVLYYFTKYLIFIAMNEERNYDEIKYFLDSPTDVEELKQLIARYEKALFFRQGV